MRSADFPCRDMYGLVRLSCAGEETFLEMVRADSGRIPESVRLFLGDRIRDALMGLEDEERARAIEEALSEVGI